MWTLTTCIAGTLPTQSPCSTSAGDVTWFPSHLLALGHDPFSDLQFLEVVRARKWEWQSGEGEHTDRRLAAQGTYLTASA